ncbi:MAG: hypothetical protein ABJH98_03355 [Reichenbachiella sp.]|uniref:hypothetical protein n=1 Tax=Reichenbachiella sp. TaxID=2184521 RepID=UPI00329762C6
METEESNNVVQIIAILAPTILALASIVTNIFQVYRNQKLEKHKLAYSDKKAALTNVIEVLDGARNSFFSAKTWFDSMEIELIKKNLVKHDMTNPVYQTLMLAVTKTPMSIKEAIGKNLLFFSPEVTRAIDTYKTEVLDKIPSMPFEKIELLKQAIDEITENYDNVINDIVKTARHSMEFE